MSGGNDMPYNITTFFPDDYNSQNNNNLYN